MSEDMRQEGPSRRWGRIGLVGVALPVLAALVLVWSGLGRQNQIDKIPVAIVNNDTIISDPQPMAAGRALTASLTNPTDSSEVLNWTLTDSDDAKAGLRNGMYYAVLTIPSDFSKAILSTGTDAPESGQVTLESNAAASQTVPYISEQVVTTATSALGNQSTQSYLKNVYAGFNQIASSTQSAADSAVQLADGTQQVQEGAIQVNSGAESLDASLDLLAAGALQLTQGTVDLKNGANQLREATSGVADGAKGLSADAGRLSSSSATLAASAEQHATRAAAGATASEKVASGASTVSSRAQGLESALSGLEGECETAGGAAEFCAKLRAAMADSRVLATESRALSRATGVVARADRALSGGARALALGDRKLAGGAASLSAGSRRLSSAAGDVAKGAAQVASGAATVSSDTAGLATGAQQAEAGAAQLATGTASLSSGAASANSGAEQLSSGLAQLAEQSPTYSDSQQTALAAVVSQPVVLTHDSIDADRTNGWLLAGIVGIVLWLAALAAALGRDVAAARRFALTPVSSRRIAAAQSIPVLGVALLQGVVVIATVFVAGVSVASSISLALLTLLAALTFSLMAYAARLAWGTNGVVVFVLFLVLQLSALGNALPLQTAPAVLQTLNGLLPLSAFVNAASQLVSGGTVFSTLSTVAVLGVWGAAAYASSLTAVKRQRMLKATPPRIAHERFDGITA
jgi:putative membrane protein